MKVVGTLTHCVQTQDKGIDEFYHTFFLDQLALYRKASEQSVGAKRVRVQMWLRLLSLRHV